MGRRPAAEVGQWVVDLATLLDRLVSIMKKNNNCRCQGCFLMPPRHACFAVPLSIPHTRSVQFAMVSIERSALVALFHSIGGSKWTRKGNWNTDAELRGRGQLPGSRGEAISLDANNFRGIPLQGVCFWTQNGGFLLFLCNIQYVHSSTTVSLSGTPCFARLVDSRIPAFGQCKPVGVFKNGAPM